MPSASDIVKDVNSFLRDSQLISKAVGLGGRLGDNELARTIGDVVGQTGYGKRRKMKGKRKMRGRAHPVSARRRKQRGRSIFGDIIGKLGTIVSAVPMAALGAVGGASQVLGGLGRRRSMRGRSMRLMGIPVENFVTSSGAANRPMA